MPPFSTPAAIIIAPRLAVRPAHETVGQHHRIAVDALAYTKCERLLGGDMIDLEPDIKKEYERHALELANFAENTTDVGLSAQDVLQAHFLIANHFYLEGIGLGGVGPKDLKLLCSAVDRQAVSWGSNFKWSNCFDVCATLLFGLIKNHPFHDANKRTAFLSALHLLHKAGICPASSEKLFEDLTVEVADAKLGKYARFNEFVKSGEPDPEVKYISWFIRKHTRKIDNSTPSITFRELRLILNRYSYDLRNPDGNYIDVVRLTRRRKLLGLGKSEEVAIWTCQVGFPRWTAQVSKAALRTVRDRTNLTTQAGVDSAAFFHGLDPMQSLIATYNKPLMSLATR